ncbi:MobF family relaxase [Embleya hyalina]|uniref:TraA/ATP-dependent exoDNAse/relaxase n=1 Tax=Embleya hyalina TaxID=516124 RepID=A0A401Z3Y1_9ACTN|nr:MobF family relaxase [Embleya hyalina]GCE01535.1 TraA/ATP-dependent exoDNAse/relaxase [Embleya hyalina]
MAWVTAIGPDMAQVDYRLTAECGCDQDAPVAYRTAGAAGDLIWFGKGLAEVGIEARSQVDPDAARLLMSGKDPRDGTVLLAPKMAVDPAGKLAPGPLLQAVRAAAAEAGVPLVEVLGDPRLVERVERAERGINGRKGDAYRVPVKDLEKIAAAAAHATGTTLDDLYPADELATAREHAGARVRIGNRGADLVLDLPKSFSAAVALAPDDLADALERTFLEAAWEAGTAVESWVGYTLSGHSGDGHTPDRVESSGLLGWMTVHRSARPIGTTAGDPHLHVHLNLASMVRSVDGKWRVFGSGGRDLYRHARAADSLVKARLRTLTRERFGMRWERDATTGAWEVVGIDRAVRTAFSRRSIDAVKEAGKDASTAQKKLAAARGREAKLDETAERDVRAEWRERAAALVDVDEMIRAAIPRGPDGPAPAGYGTPPPILPTPTEIAAIVLDPENGLTAHRKSFTRADLLASVIDAIPVGLVDVAQAEDLVDAVLREPGLYAAVRLPDEGTTRLTHADRYTTADILAAEQTVIDHTIAGCLGERFAQVDPDAAAAALGVAEVAQGWEYSPEQVEALDRLLVGGNAIDAVAGAASAGKTTLMTAARAAWETRGLVVRGASTAAVASENLYSEAGIASRNLAQWAMAMDAGDAFDGVDVLVVDEAAMSDDRMLARLCVEAARSHTKIALVGDPLQLRAIGVGGLFAEVHRLTAGPSLAENRRQRDPAERDALAAWREGDRHGALHTLAAASRIHATDLPEQAHAEMVTAWADARTEYIDTDPHERIARVLMLAARNTDTEKLNALARKHARTSGELAGPDVRYRRADGDDLVLAVGDVVRVRRNTWSRGAGPDVLNGYRGIVLAQDERGVRIEWRRDGADGPVLSRAWIAPARIARGDLSHGYAMTIAAAQGLTCDRAVTYGVDADAHTLYPGITRARERTDTWLALTPLEDDTTRARLGAPRGDAERLVRAVDACVDRIAHDRPDTLATHELQEPAAPAPAPAVDRLARARATLARLAADRERADLLAAMRTRPFGRRATDVLIPHAQQHEARAARTEHDAHERVLAADAGLRTAEAGQGPAVRRLEERYRTTATAADHLDRADHHQAWADEHRRRADDARARLRELERLGRLGRIGLWHAGLTRAQVAAGIEAVRAEVDQADHAAGIEHGHRAREIGDSHRLVPATIDARAELATLHRDWPHLHADALAADTTTAHHAVARAAAGAETARTEAQADLDRARGLREEAALRADMPAERSAAEDALRVDLDRERREQQVRRQRAERERQQQQQRHRRPPTPAGPAPGHGFSL